MYDDLMDIATEQIKTFLEIVRKGSFSKAAVSLGITQAALSIRVRKLEETLEKTLMIRAKSGLTLTEAGRDFQEFAEAFEVLQNEYTHKKVSSGLSGELRIGCFSTIGRSLVLPAINKLLRDHESIKFSFMVREVRELFPLLQAGEVDIIFLDHELARDGVVQEFLGNEEYVFVTGKKRQNQHIFLNHDPNDPMSFKYFEALGQKKIRLERRYLDEIYSVLDGVSMGIGVSVLPIHLAIDHRGVLIPQPNKKLKSPVYICYKQRAFYPKVVSEAINILKETMSKKLKTSVFT